MFAIECSNPEATNTHIGKNIHTALLIPSFAPNDIHTARQTSQLHNIPSVKASVNDSEILAAAVLIVSPPSKPPVIFHCPESDTRYATMRLPAKFPTYTTSQDHNNFARVIRRSASEIIIRQFPVKSSAPAMMTMIKPAGKINPAVSFADAESVIVCVTRLAACAPNAMNAPARMPRRNFADVLRFAFLTPMLIAESAISEGELYNEFFTPFVCLRDYT